MVTVIIKMRKKKNEGHAHFLDTSVKGIVDFRKTTNETKADKNDGGSQSHK